MHSVLQSPVIEVLEAIWSIERMKETMSSLSLDMEKLPVGRLTRQ